MCGIIGYVSIGDEVYKKDKTSFLEDALVLDTFRGMDSTGLVTVCDDFQVSTCKSLGEGWGFVLSPDFCTMPNGWAAIGHNRAATTGKVTVDNAHPFTTGSITMVHNGTLTDMGRSLPDFCNNEKVDSFNIARALASTEPNKASEDVLRHIRGAYALAWTDDRDQSINLVRNAQRPMHFSYNRGKTILWFMSDGTHLDMISKRRWCLSTDMGAIYSLDVLNHIKWKKGSLIPEVTKYSPFVAPIQRQPWPMQQSGSYGKFEVDKYKEERRNLLRVPLSHRIYLNGKRDAAPSGLVAELYDVTELSPDTPLKFLPQGWTRYPDHKGQTHDGYGMSYGTVWIPDWECEWSAVIHNVHEVHAPHTQAWTVLPYGVTSADPCDSGLAIIGRVKKFSVDEPPPEKEEDDDIPNSLVGPFGRLCSQLEWLGLTQHGCSHCSCDLLMKEHEDVWWVGEMENSPLCGGCADYLTTGETK